MCQFGTFLLFRWQWWHKSSCFSLISNLLNNYGILQETVVAMLILLSGKFVVCVLQDHMLNG